MTTEPGSSGRSGFAIAISISDGAEVSLEGLRQHLREALSTESREIQDIPLAKGSDDTACIHGTIVLHREVEEEQAQDYVQRLHQSTYQDKLMEAQLISVSEEEEGEEEEEEEAEEYDGKQILKQSRQVSVRFFDWLHSQDFGDNEAVDLRAIERDAVHHLFVAFAQKHLPSLAELQQIRLEALVMTALRNQSLLRTKKYGGGVIMCSFAMADKVTFAPLQERKSAREKALDMRRESMTNKGGVIVEEEFTTIPEGPVLPIHQDVTVSITMEQSTERPIELKQVTLGGSHKKLFQVVTQTPIVLTSDSKTTFQLSCRAKSSGALRANVTFLFENHDGKQFAVLRSVLLRSGDSKMYELLKPTTPYVKKNKKQKKRQSEDLHTEKEKVLDPPRTRDGGHFSYKGLKSFKVPVDVRELVEKNEIESALVPPTYATTSYASSAKELKKTYSTFWQSLLWTSELQAYEDIKLFDIEKAKLEKQGGLFKLYVSGLAEGRPSVLRGDVVLCSWNRKLYRGRVVAVELLDVLMEFHKSFHRSFNVSVDRVDLVRFTFGRTAFRTSHTGALFAPQRMGPDMLMPQLSHAHWIRSNQERRDHRYCPDSFRWTKPLNEKQKQAVQQIVKGSLRPMPSIIFGPPGTGKTTTMVETVYQLANLHTYDRTRQNGKLKILLVAPSNDATDLLVEKLSPFFPPSELIRVLAYTRSIDQVPTVVRPYCHEGSVTDVQIVVTTLSMAARLWCTGNDMKRGHFDVLCVDEAGHATEPEVIAVAATIMNWRGKNPGQLVLAGDPMQLGPVVSSQVCEKFGMQQSFMERLVKTSPAYALNEKDEYPQDLVTLLVSNYRSHPDILKLPNEMFYRNQLIPCGDRLSTHSMVKWEYLAKKGFPVMFHAIDGENMREGNSPSWFNPQEAEQVVEYVKKLVKESKPPIREEDIGIITPYARQVQKIRLALQQSKVGDVKVGSVETFQGQERRVIIISTVRSEQDLLLHDLKYNLGFVSNEKRFNVAVTRAKALLVVIGNPRVLQTDEEHWLPLLRFCRDNGSWMGDEWDEDATDSDEDGFDVVTNSDAEEPTGAEWEVVPDNEACGYINREE
ncbi:Putative helicase MOV-10 [Seminavis robusta]|uniref:RNA helicase n=1 Tax=Seminavis robusta TaxID=568900 RepID=A0A9N8DVM5_9STRA|nr:Putative helicase MOV-10 [Seminavis robusta]|eukprot:Sro394_g133900.1 Putative helicase MOV-10 (1087) ;mRNA; r:51124-54519